MTNDEFEPTSSIPLSLTTASSITFTQPGNPFRVVESAPQPTIQLADSIPTEALKKKDFLVPDKKVPDLDEFKSYFTDSLFKIVMSEANVYIDSMKDYARMAREYNNRARQYDKQIADEEKKLVGIRESVEFLKSHGHNVAPFTSVSRNAVNTISSLKNSRESVNDNSSEYRDHWKTRARQILDINKRAKETGKVDWNRQHELLHIILEQKQFSHAYIDGKGFTFHLDPNITPTFRVCENGEDCSCTNLKNVYYMGRMRFTIHRKDVCETTKFYKGDHNCDGIEIGEDSYSYDGMGSPITAHARTGCNQSCWGGFRELRQGAISTGRISDLIMIANQYSYSFNYHDMGNSTDAIIHKLMREDKNGKTTISTPSQRDTLSDELLETVRSINFR